MFTTWLKTFDTFVIFATTFGSIMLFLTGIGLIVKPISTGIACGLTITNKRLHEINEQKCNKFK